MKLACADFSWPLLAHERVLKLIALLDIEAVDIGLMGNRSHLRPETIRQDIPRWAGILQERLVQSGLALADLFVIPWSDFETMAPNNPDPRQREDGDRLFADMLELARRLDARGMTVLPGVRFGEEPLDASIRRSAAALAPRVEAAARHGVRLSVEGHLGSNVETPERLAHLLALTPGLELTLDYGHFVYQGIPEAEIESLSPHTRHFHCRGGSRRQLQTTFQANTIDFSRAIDRLLASGYDGYFAIEYVWQDWQGCNETDNVAETIQFRDLARAIIAAHGG